MFLIYFYSCLLVHSQRCQVLLSNPNSAIYTQLNDLKYYFLILVILFKNNNF